MGGDGPFFSLIVHPKAELVAAAGVRPDILAKAADEYGVTSTYTDYREILDKEDLDGVGLPPRPPPIAPARPALQPTLEPLLAASPA